MSDYYIEKENSCMAETGIEYFLQSFEQKKGGANPHIHPAVEIIHIIDGEFTAFVNDKEYFLKSGDTLLIRANAIHRLNVLWDKPSRYYVMKFKLDFLLNIISKERSSQYMLAFALINSDSKTVWRKDEGADIVRAVSRLNTESSRNGYGSDIAVRISYAEVILALLRGIESESSSADSFNGELVRRIYDAIVYINRRYGENITARDCSDHIFLSYSYFSRNFRRITGRTFTEYLTSTRINNAEKLLFSSQKSISEIAEECGFSSFAYFSAIYKKIKGVSPSDARAKSAAQRDRTIKQVSTPLNTPKKTVLNTKKDHSGV